MLWILHEDEAPLPIVHELTSNKEADGSFSRHDEVQEWQSDLLMECLNLRLFLLELVNSSPSNSMRTLGEPRFRAETKTRWLGTEVRLVSL